MNQIINALAQLNALEVTTLVNFILVLCVYRVWRDFERREAERKNRGRSEPGMAHMVFGILAFVTSLLLLETFMQIMLKRSGRLDLYRKPVLLALAEGRPFKEGLFMLREVRERSEMSRWDLAKKSGLSYWDIRDYEENKKLPGLFEAKKLAAALGVPMDELVKLQEEAKKP